MGVLPVIRAFGLWFHGSAHCKTYSVRCWQVKRQVMLGQSFGIAKQSGKQTFEAYTVRFNSAPDPESDQQSREAQQSPGVGWAMSRWFPHADRHGSINDLRCVPVGLTEQIQRGRLRISHADRLGIAMRSRSAPAS